ncbi:hypothetical protein [Pseudomonas sp. PH1b]|uniref:hypothetical protein n=1 Tax=Pseudomonas sp. PH1b TaxID=1397282 RepID=UPI0004683813|nr:hypothetical protein [Pseudomonas sp. PH1b]
MYYTQQENDRRQLKSQWENALRDSIAFLYRTDDDYHYLLLQADEGYQLGLICLSERQEMVTRALGAYSWNVEHNITRETHWCLGCCYHFQVDGEVIGTIGTEGHYRDLQGELLSNILGQPPELYLRAGRFDREFAGDVEGLRIMRDG